MISHSIRQNTAMAMLALLWVLTPFHSAFSQDTNLSRPSGVQSATPTPLAQPLTVEEKFKLHLEDTYGPGAWLASASTSGIRQWINSPPEWGQGMKGYGRRFASSMGETAVKNTVRFGVGAALREDPRYFPSGRRGLLPRAWHAVTFVFVPRNDHGGRTVGAARIAGALSAGFVSNAWYPERLSDTSHALSRAGISLGGEAAVNLFHEFWPDIRRTVLGR
jgi:hypothetical protein